MLKLSNCYMPTLKEVPVDAELASHQLLLRGAFMRKVSSGIYAFLPLGIKVLHRISQIVREEMDAIGNQELLMPILQPAELWHQSGRWDDYGPELMRLTDRHEHQYALSPTQEEMITELVHNELRSYKDLPLCLYHIQWKYRDEIRPRFGLLRSREFLMKDAYSFHASQESLNQHYDLEYQAYSRICERLGLAFRPVEADSGQIGGKVTTEFMALADAGEAELALCPDETCGYAANLEVATGIAHPRAYEIEGADDRLTKLETPIEGTIAALAGFLHIDEDQTVKAFSGKDAAGRISVLFVPGDHEVNPVKVEKLLPGFMPLSDAEMEAAGLVKGYMGPVGLPTGVQVVADRSLQGVKHWLVGANEPGYHLAGAAPGRDFAVDQWADLVTVADGDLCPHCGRPLTFKRGIEVGQIFQLGTKYSESMGVTYMDEDGKEQPFIMGCYGWGVTRSLAAVVEQLHDADGMIWPASIAPAQLLIVALDPDDEQSQTLSREIGQELEGLGFSVALDDRAARPGFKFKDADLIGWPLQLTIGKRGLAAGKLELKVRASGQKSEVAIADAAEACAQLLRQMLEELS
ncbi:MAG: proline--tRNA ligase [Coriobacteriales bacterium]|jgi:prolyl-tRNA synthetase|nr:proline--tRNA ligase [Coriobacteriales bacterium]